MTELTDEAVKALLDGATPGPWRYRPHEFDDWGVVRGGAFNQEWGGYPHLAQVRDPDKLDEQTLSEHRVSGEDPWEGNARLTAAAPDLARALLDARAELAAAQQREAGLLAALQDPLVVHPMQRAARVLHDEAMAAAYLGENVTDDEAAMMQFIDALGGKTKVINALHALATATKGATP